MVRKYAGVCLGKIGPVDPGKLEFVVSLAECYEDIAARNKILDVFSVGFCVELLQVMMMVMMMTMIMILCYAAGAGPSQGQS